jgi:hypothetical protein
MLNGRAPALALGLFLFFAFPLGAEERFSLYSGAGSLWVEDPGAAFSWYSGLAFKSEPLFYADAGIGQVVSDLPWAEGSVMGGLGKLGYDTPFFGFDFAALAFSLSPFNSRSGSVAIYNDGGQGIFVNLRTPVHIRDLDIVPSFSYGRGAWEEGSLYWFFGKPDIPSFNSYGLSLEYRDQHELGFHYLAMDADILNNESVRLFTSHLDAYIAYYRLSRETSRFRFGGSLGWFYAAAEASGGLSTANQHYFLFPYYFYNLSASLNAQAGFGAIEFRHTLSIFQYQVILGAVHIFQGEGAADIHYLYKNLFGGGEGFDTMPLDTRGIGAAFLMLDAGFPSLRPGKQKNPQLAAGLRKLFAIPWGYERLLPDDGDSLPPSGTSADTMGELIRTALLSGLSLYASLKW